MNESFMPGVHISPNLEILTFIGNKPRFQAKCNSPRHAVRTLLRMGISYEDIKQLPFLNVK